LSITHSPTRRSALTGIAALIARLARVHRR